MNIPEINRGNLEQGDEVEYQNGSEWYSLLQDRKRIPLSFGGFLTIKRTIFENLHRLPETPVWPLLARTGADDLEIDDALLGLYYAEPIGEGQFANIICCKYVVTIHTDRMAELKRMMR